MECAFIPTNSLCTPILFLEKNVVFFSHGIKNWDHLSFSNSMNIIKYAYHIFDNGFVHCISIKYAAIPITLINVMLFTQMSAYPKYDAKTTQKRWCTIILKSRDIFTKFKSFFERHGYDDKMQGWKYVLIRTNVDI